MVSDLWARPRPYIAHPGQVHAFITATPDGPLNLRNEKYRTDSRPIIESGPGAANYTANFSRAYLRHLTMAGEILSCTLLTIHNLHFYLDLMAQARAHLDASDYGTWHYAWIERYEAGMAARSTS